MTKDNRYIQQCIELAKESNGTKRAKHCAILVRGKDRLAVGYNSYITHSAMYRINKEKPFLHSEADALMSVRHKDLSGGTMYVARVTKGKNVGLSRPCATCMQMMRMFEIKKVVYTTDMGIAIEEL